MNKFGTGYSETDIETILMNTIVYILLMLLILSTSCIFKYGITKKIGI